jgi:hypothetical protein
MNWLPPVQITQNRAFVYEATVAGQDWTGIPGTVTIKDYPSGETLLEKAVTGNASGALSFSLTQAETNEFPALPVLGFRHVGVFQIAMSDGQLFQGNVGVAGLV